MRWDIGVVHTSHIPLEGNFTTLGPGRSTLISLPFEDDFTTLGHGLLHSSPSLLRVILLCWDMVVVHSFSLPFEGDFTTLGHGRSTLIPSPSCG